MTLQITFLSPPPQSIPAAVYVAQQAAIEARRTEEHQAGLHPWGSMRRDCPLCRGDNVGGP